ncbi:uncharacterized protein J3R85_012434 [Psidium guajava]|nr:uncharacterized protein J3R85_012434 [Psidium guajava]
MSKIAEKNQTHTNRWTAPEQGNLKLSVDASWCSRSREAAAAAGVLRDHNGTLIVGFSKMFQAPSAVVAETLAPEEKIFSGCQTPPSTADLACNFSSYPIMT